MHLFTSKNIFIMCIYLSLSSERSRLSARARERRLPPRGLGRRGGEAAAGPRLPPPAAAGSLKRPLPGWGPLLQRARSSSSAGSVHARAGAAAGRVSRPRRVLRQPRSLRGEAGCCPPPVAPPRPPPCGRRTPPLRPVPPPPARRGRPLRPDQNPIKTRGTRAQLRHEAVVDDCSSCLELRPDYMKARAHPVPTPPALIPRPPRSRAPAGIRHPLPQAYVRRAEALRALGDVQSLERGLAGASGWLTPRP